MSRRRKVNASNQHESSHHIVCEEDIPDFASVALYIPALQVVGSAFVCCVTTILSCWLLPHNAISSIRSISLALGVALLTLHKPVTIGKARCMDSIFNSIRPAVLIYLTSLVVEQLAHSCVTQGLSIILFRWWLYQVCMVIIMGSGIFKALFPFKNHEKPFILSLVALAVAALMPPSPSDLGGPLCSSATGIQALERTSRAILFSSTYCILVFAAHPIRFSPPNATMNSVRAASSSIWILGIVPHFLPFVVLQVAILLFSRLGKTKKLGYTCTNTESDQDIEERFPSYASSPRSQSTKSAYGHYVGEHLEDHTVAYKLHDELSLYTNPSNVHTLSEYALTPQHSPIASHVSEANSSTSVIDVLTEHNPTGGFSFQGLHVNAHTTNTESTPISRELALLNHNKLRCLSDPTSCAGSEKSSRSTKRTVSAEQLKAAADAL